MTKEQLEQENKKLKLEIAALKRDLTRLNNLLRAEAGKHHL